MIAVKLSSTEILMNVLATEIALVLDELEAEHILSQQIQDVLHCETDALDRRKQGTDFPASFVKATHFPVSSEVMRSALVEIKCHAFVLKTLLCVFFVSVTG